MLPSLNTWENVSVGHPEYITLSKFLICRPKGLTEPEAWAILYQAVQALQDLFLSDGITTSHCVPLVTPSTLLLSVRGRVKLSQTCVNPGYKFPVYMVEYLAPEYRPNKKYTDTEAEKMWIFGLGESLKRATLTSHTATTRLSLNFCQVLSDMTRPQASSRASLMYLLDVISDYCKRNQQTRPFSHIVMDLHQEAMAGIEEMNFNIPWSVTAMPEIQNPSKTRYLNPLPPSIKWKPSNIQPLEKSKITKEASTSMENLSVSVLNVPGTVNRPKSMCIPSALSNFEFDFSKINSFDTALKPDSKQSTKAACLERQSNNGMKNRTRMRRNPVQRAASRLYHADSVEKDENNLKNTENHCVGPEFIIRANLPSKKITIPDCKGIKRIVRVIMLNGQKIDVECNPNNVTAGQLFEEIIRHERIQENFMLGLSALMAGDFIFLPSDARVCKAVNSPNNSSEITLFVRVRFFLPNLRGLRNSQARHLLYLQIRRSILEYQLPCMFRQLVELGGLALQIEFGDFNQKEHGFGDYFILEHYVPEVITCNIEKSKHLKDEMIKCHKNKKGLDVVRAEEEYIELAQNLPYYGGHFCLASWVQKDTNHKSVWLFISAHGINLYEKLDMSNPFSLSLLEMFEWKSIQTLCYSKHYFCIIPHTSDTNPFKLKKYKLKMEFKKSYYMFRLASLHHQFFLRLKTEYASLQRLSEAFGIPLKEIKNETNSLYKLDTLTHSLNHDLNKNAVNTRPEFKIEFHFPSKRIKSELGRDLKTQRSKSTGNFTNECVSESVFEVFQNKENENPKNDDNKIAQEDYNSDTYSNINIWDKRRGVKMGVRAFENNSGHRVCRSMETMPLEPGDELEKFSLQSVSLHYSSSSTRSPLLDKKNDDVYVVDTSINSNEMNFFPNFQETLSQSLLDKLNDLSFAEERFLCSVVIQRDHKGSLGLQITEGSDGKVYVQSVIPGGPADVTKKVKRGDQIVAVNQQNLLSYNYQDALKFLKSCGNLVELVLSQNKNNFYNTLDGISTKKTFLNDSTLKSCLNLTNVNESHLTALKMENTIRKLKHFSYAGDSLSSFGSADTPIEKHLIESCHDITNFKKHPVQNLPEVNPRSDEPVATSDVPYHKHIRYNFETETVNCRGTKELPQLNVSASCNDINLLGVSPEVLEDNSNGAKRSLEDCRNMNIPIALPRSLGLSRKWRGPVRYPVTPIKKERIGSEDDSACLLTNSDEEQVFI